jgi:integrase
VREAATVAELCDAYFSDAEEGRVLTRRGDTKKRSTLAIDKGRIERHIKPLLGTLTVAAVTREDIDRFLHDVAEGKTAGRTKTAKKRGLARVSGGRTAATRTVGLLGAIFAYAAQRRMRTDNPAHGVRRFADRRRERRLSDEEYGVLGRGLLQGEATLWPPAIAVARFLALTGWRSGEVLALRWREIDLGRRTAWLADTKTGFSLRPLSHAACDVLRSVPCTAGERVFPASRGDGETLLHFKKFWPRIAKLAALPLDVTPHTLRHSFASIAADLGYSESTIAALVGHKGRSTTSRYLHAVLLAAADAVASKVAELMGEATPLTDVVPLSAVQ